LIGGQFAQSGTGELRLAVHDASDAPVQSTVELVSEGTRVSEHLETDEQGTVVVKRLPFGRYRLSVSHAGFTTDVSVVDIASALPIERRLVLSVAPVQSEVSVSVDDTLLDLRQTATVNRIGAESLQHRIGALPGRALPDAVNTQPGWLLEANGVLHPRGSEYQVQFVVDGMPLTDNRSPSFAPEMDVDAVHAMNIFTAGYPAEYGRKLGGVVEIVTAGNAQRGLHGDANVSAGSLGTLSGSSNADYGWGHNLFGVSASMATTDRYLDPPVEENFTNHATGSNVALRFEREFSEADRLGAIVRHGQMRFQVPNERVQEDAGQRQERSTAETSGQLSFQHVFSGSVLADVQGMVRSSGAGLSSNALSTPIAAQQDRGFDEGYVKATISARAGSHEWKAGFDADAATIRESFSYHITNRAQFDRDTPRNFSFSDQQPDREQSLFVQDRLTAGPWTINAGIRWDHYQLLVDENALSPRLGVAWAWPRADLVVRASYDRAFQTPAIENLLLASSASVEKLNDEVVRLPVRPSRGNFYELGISKRLGKLRLDATHFDREMSNFADDDVLLNTGVSFPIAFRRAQIRGSELKLDLPRWRAVTASVSYTNMTGVGWLPISGGLLLGDDATAALTSADRFPISQDQRNTLRSRVSYQLSSKAWVAAAVSYGSGLPVEFAGDTQDAIAQYGQRIVDRVDLVRGRVRPSTSLDLSGSIVAFQAGKQRLRVQADVVNITDRLNVINFAGLFSGTALAAPRSVAVRLQAEW
jgi:outer membrane cobalamin receptor